MVLECVACPTPLGPGDTLQVGDTKPVPKPFCEVGGTLPEGEGGRESQRHQQKVEQLHLGIASPNVPVAAFKIEPLSTIIISDKAEVGVTPAGMGRVFLCDWGSTRWYEVSARRPS